MIVNNFYVFCILLFPFKTNIVPLFLKLTIEPPHKLEKEVFNAKKIGIIFQNDAKETEEKLHITKNGNKSWILKTPLLRFFVLLLKSSI
jgi:hypothetical protein